MAATPKRFKLHDDTVNTFGFRMLTSGADLEQFKRNPVMLYDHDDYKHLPIGRWENIAIEQDGIYADAVFDLKDAFAAQIAQKVDDGFLNMASIGAVPIALCGDSVDWLEGQSLPTIKTWRVREGSITAFGSNHNALSLYDESGKKIELNENSLVKLFDKHKPQIIITNPPMKDLLKSLKLSDTSTEAEGVTAVNALEQRAQAAEIKLADIEKKAGEAKKAEAVILVDAAIAEQRIEASEKGSYLNLFDKDFDSTKTILAGTKKRVTAKDIVGGAGNSNPDEKLLNMSWEDLDKSGKLVLLKDKYPEKYTEMYKEQFGV